jgi:hypothetical protein
MKIEIIVEVAGMKVGTQKDVPTQIAKELIDTKVAVEVKAKKATKTDETKA